MQFKREWLMGVVLMGWMAIGASADNLLPTGDLVVARSHHTATLLEDGRVLVTGGFTNSTREQLSSAEIYDPSTGTFTLTDSMARPRWGHSAVRLDDGRVLVVGGWISSFTTATAETELYDPATETFSPGPSMTVRRADHPPIVKLNDGRLVLPGGTFEGGFGTATGRIDIYDPATGAFSYVADLALSRRDHAATLLDDGTILLASGVFSCCNVVENDLRRRSGEIFDPVLNLSSLISNELSANRARVPAAIGLPGARGLVAGEGLGADLYESATGTFVPTGDPGTRYGQGPSGLVRLLDGRILASGIGLWTYDVAANAFTPGPSGFWAIFHTATRLQDGSVLLAGGISEGGLPSIRSAFLFVPALRQVEIDIKPGSDPNGVNPGSQGVIPVAILTTDDLDATTVDSQSVLFGKTGTEASPVHAAIEDVDHDGDLDLVLQFRVSETAIECGDTTAWLTGTTLDGIEFEGFDSVKVVGCQ